MNKKMFRTFISHSIVSVALCAAAFMSMTVEAANVYYRWKTAGDGNWNDKANWEWSSTSDGTYADLGEEIPVPNGSTNHVYFTLVGTYTVTLDNDVTVAQIYTGGGAAGTIVKPTFNLNRHKFSVWNNNYSFGGITGGPGTTRIDSLTYPNTVWSFTNGVLVAVNNGAKLYGGGNGSNVGLSHGAYVFDNVSFLLKGGILWKGDFRIFVQNGAAFTNNAELATYSNDNRVPSVWRPEFCVRGSGSEYYSPNGVKLGNNEAGLFAMDGALVNVESLIVGANAAATESGKMDVCSTNCYAFATNGTIMVRGDLEVGSNYEKCVRPHLKIMEKNGVIMQTESYGKLKIYENTGAHIDIDIPAGGFTDSENIARAPLQANDIEFIARDANMTQGDAFKLNVTGAADWLEAHQGSKLILVELATANPSLLEQVKDSVVSDVDVSNFKVSSDGRKLVLAKAIGLVISVR